MKWKDWFYYTKGQRMGVVMLLVLILVVLLLHWSMRSLIADDPILTDAFEQQAKQFLDSLQTHPDGSYAAQTRFFSRNDYSSRMKTALPEPVLFLFNPNELDSAGFVKLGLKPYMASNILKYRAKGGKFRKPEDFAKVWGLTPEQMNALLPYISIPAETVQTPANPMPSGSIKKEVISLELNSADTSQLKQIRGIGSGYAKRIVAYRNRLGGYVNVEQLKEIWGMTPELFAQIAPHFTVNSQAINQILVNRASVERLMSHPYLTFSRAKAIYDLRRSKGKLTSFDQLQSLSELDASTLAKLKPYLSFQ
jgi:competence ComEA-like helix-hairpin-helix protein